MSIKHNVGLVVMALYSLNAYSIENRPLDPDEDTFFEQLISSDYNVTLFYEYKDKGTSGYRNSGFKINNKIRDNLEFGIFHNRKRSIKSKDKVDNLDKTKLRLLYKTDIIPGLTIEQQGLTELSDYTEHDGVDKRYEVSSRVITEIKDIYEMEYKARYGVKEIFQGVENTSSLFQIKSSSKIDEQFHLDLDYRYEHKNNPAWKKQKKHDLMTRTTYLNNKLSYEIDESMSFSYGYFKNIKLTDSIYRQKNNYRTDEVKHFYSLSYQPFSKHSIKLEYTDKEVEDTVLDETYVTSKRVRTLYTYTNGDFVFKPYYIDVVKDYNVNTEGNRTDNKKWQAGVISKLKTYYDYWLTTEYYHKQELNSNGQRKDESFFNVNVSFDI